MRIHFGWLASLLCIGVIFLIILHHYGTTLPCPWPPDEIVYIQPAQNLAEGKGMGIPVCKDLLPGIAERAYLQVPFYFLAVSVWGKAFSFEISSVRWFNRVLGVVGLLLLFALARRWGVSTRMALLAVFLTAMDISYQLNSNIARMDVLCLVLTLATLLAFTMGWEKNDDRSLLLAGIFAAASILTHLLAAPVVALLGFLLLCRRQWKSLFWFSLPIAVGISAWLLYGAQDWQAFISQLHAPFQRKAERTFMQFIAHALMLGGLSEILGFSPSNMPPWLAILVPAALALKRSHLFLRRWQFAVLLMAYATAALNGEMWYFGWFTPFGYLLTVFFMVSLFRLQPTRQTYAVLLAIAIAWTGYQAVQVGRCIVAVPRLQQAYQHFYADLERMLPRNGTVVLFCAPDPYFHLCRARPDLQLFELLPLRMDEEALQRLMNRSDAFVFVIWGWAMERRIIQVSLRAKEERKRWVMPSAIGAYEVAMWLKRQGHGGDEEWQ